MSALQEVRLFSDEMTAWRRHLHAHPELGYQEFQTADFITEKLKSWDIPFERVTETGIVATLKVGEGDGKIGLRADMDALPIEEESSQPWRSTAKGVMHACGHDGHTATLLGAVKHLNETRRFSGTVHAIFQPAEEGLAGARAMLDAGLLERFPCDMIFGQHNDPDLPEGQICASKGLALAASDRFSITVRGKGGHAARPHETIDPILAGAHITVCLQSILARRLDPVESGVISITQFHAGRAHNVIADTAILEGTARSLSPAIRDEMSALIESVAQSAAATVGAQTDFSYERGYPPVVNASQPTEIAVQAAMDIVGQDNVLSNCPPIMGAEDFAYFAEAVPSCFIRIGAAGPDQDVKPLHNSAYDFNDRLLPVGASWFARVVERTLSAGRE